MKRFAIAVLCLTLVSAPLALAQAPQGPPKPGPEHKRLAYFVGKWSGEADMKKSDFGPAGKIMMTERSELFPGGFYVVAHSDGKGPMGEMKGLSILGYDAKKKVYTYYAVNNGGMSENAEGTAKGPDWTWTSEQEMNGKMVKSRFTMKELSPTSYSFKWESSTGGAAMATIMEGKMTKAEAKPAATAKK
jgi:hypothetical protein